MRLLKILPIFIGGSADLAGSNKTMIKGAEDFMPGHMMAVIFGLAFVNLQWVLQ